MANKAVALPARTAIQSGAALIVVEAVDAFAVDMNERQYGALVALLVLGFSVIQNLIEWKANRALLIKQPPA
jgi:hypothetical protein